MKIGYARVSTDEQNLDGQIKALNKEGCEKIFSEKVSGVKSDREELNKAIFHLREGDTLVVYKLDRLGRSLKQLIALVEEFKEKGVNLKSIDDSIDTNSATGTFFFHVISAFAQLEHSLIKERTKVGLNAARSRGRVGGRPTVHKGNKKELAYKMYMENKNTVDEIAKTLDMSRSTVYRYIEKKSYESSNKPI